MGATLSPIAGVGAHDLSLSLVGTKKSAYGRYAVTGRGNRLITETKARFVLVDPVSPCNIFICGSESACRRFEPQV
jgi:hypothetical protein